MKKFEFVLDGKKYLIEAQTKSDAVKIAWTIEADVQADKDTRVKELTDAEASSWRP